MCGIAGLAALDGALDGEDVAVVAAMVAVLGHRGPDGSGAWHDELVALGHRRLAIIDTSDAGAQPMVSPSGRYVVSFNGEIYNHRGLAARLRGPGWQPRGHSDTEVLLAAIDAWGVVRFAQEADGQFAFALYDRRDRKLFLARDRFGEKPVAYARRGGVVCFASEVRSFEQVPGLALRLAPDAIADYFRLGYFPGTATVYEDVVRVPPATIVEFDLAGAGTDPVVHTYWQPPWADEPAGDVPSRDELLELLSSSTRDRLVSDRPIGAFLSGGIDSSLVCALAARHTTGALKTFTMGWDDVEYDESEQAAAVAAALGCDHTSVRMGRADVLHAYERLGDVLDEPFADSSLLAVQLVATTARERVVVALSGDGGDELFAGYYRHRWLLHADTARRRAPRWARRGAAWALRRSAPLIDRALRPLSPDRRPRLPADKARKLAGALAAPGLTDAYQGLIAGTTEIGRPWAMPEPLRRAIDDGRDRDAVLRALRTADLVGYLPDDVLTKVDRATMSVSLESRTPFLHPAVAERALRLPASALLGTTGGKQPLRGMLAEVLPGVSFTQTKAGFAVPIASLLRTELREPLGDAVSTFATRGAPVALPWAALRDDLLAGSDEPARLLWSLLMFELWAARATSQVAWA